VTSQHRRGRFQLAKQVGDRGFFADVSVVLDCIPNERLAFAIEQLESDPRNADWIAGIQFGVAYALQQLPSAKANMSVLITDLHTNPVDSSSLTVAFATCFAVWDASGFVADRPPYFDESKMSFVFPQ
jgi:hypothetical protein